MSKEEAGRFTAAWDKDGAIEQAIRALPKEQCDSLEAIARVAQDLGYDLVPEELAEAFEAKRAADLEMLNGAELSDEELEQVSGGVDTTACASDYNPNDWCWFSDRCLSINNFYHANPECQQTYEPTENCGFNDNCNSAVNLNYPTNPKRNSRGKVIPT